MTNFYMYDFILFVGWLVMCANKRLAFTKAETVLIFLYFIFVQPVLICIHQFIGVSINGIDKKNKKKLPGLRH